MSEKVLNKFYFYATTLLTYSGIKAGETTKLIDFDGLYTGCDIDAETGLTYHWNRWREEDGDSWLSQDPARDGLNWYGYAGQNPTNFIDKNGLFYYNGNGEQVSSLSGEVERSESSSPTNNTTQEPSISGGTTGQNNTPNAPNSNPNENDKSTKPNYLNNNDENGIPDSDYLFSKNPKKSFFQNSKVLDFIKNFRLNACNLMVYLFTVQEYTGYMFSASEICYLIGFAQNETNPTNQNEKCLTSAYRVQKRTLER